MARFLALAVTFGSLLAASAAAGDTKPIKILFLGDNGAHRPADRFAQLQPVLAKRGIDLTYTAQAESLSPQTLTNYDGLIIYANTTEITPDQDRVLLAFVENGKGFIPLHCASYCFLNSPAYIQLVGAQFKRHGTGTFRTSISEPNHPVMKGFGGFESWDETYVHTKHHEPGRTVLEYRAEGDKKEPWTWIRSQGKGRVFYTAWGHDQRTWAQPGFHNLVERGIRWATGHDPTEAPEFRDEVSFQVPELNLKRTDVEPFQYVDVGKKIPNYTRGAKWGAQDEPLSQMQVPLAPAKSLKHLIVPKGFHVELYAAEPQLGGKPIAMNWDERGRVWIAETYDYPNEIQPAGAGRDRIRICEDTDGDGRADTFTVFADKLSIPTSILFARGGAIIFSDTKTLFLRDTNGDDVADERTMLFGTWSQVDTHGGPSNMQYGLDNWIWAMQGYNNSRLDVGGETHQFRQGFFRFRPDGSKFEFLRSTDNNTWGLGISEEGLIFGSTANRNPSVYMPFANRYYEAVRGWTPSLVLPTIADTYLFHAITDKIRQVDQFGGYTAGAGHSLYTARHYPKAYWNRTAFVCEPTGHLVGTFLLQPQGADFRSSSPFNLLASDDEWTAPIMAEVGPDGNVWVIDWYNYIVQHNPTPVGFTTGKGAAYETDLRDKKHGRVYRIVYDGKGSAEKEPSRFSLLSASPEKLVETLKHSNLFWRRHAQRLLVERGKQDVFPALYTLARDTSCDEIGLNVGVIHALWTLHGLGAFDGSNSEALAVATSALGHPSAGVRRNAVQVLPNNLKSVATILEAKLLQDPDAQVRLATLLALADRPASAAVGEAVVSVFNEPVNTVDRWIPDAAICACAKNSDAFLQALRDAKSPHEKLVAAAAVVAEHRARSGPFDAVEPIVAHLAETDPALADAVVQGLAKGWPKDQRPRLTDQAEQDLERLAPRLSPERRSTLLQLATLWGSQKFENLATEIANSLWARVRDESLDNVQRSEAARELVALRTSDDKTVQSLIELVTPRTSPDLAAALLRALEKCDAEKAGGLLVDKLATLTPAARSAAIGVLLGRPAWTFTLLDQAERGTAVLSELSLDQRQALSQHPDARLRRRAQDLLRRGGVLPNSDRRKVLEDLLPVAKLQGDPAAGKLVYTKQCAKCHVHSGEGQRVGPDLTGMAVHPKEELLSNILDPSRSVEGNFRVYTVTTSAGQVLTGLLASESKTAIELFDAEGKRQTVLREDIDELAASTKSLMPEGFEKQLSSREFQDLLEFLTQRGKYLPLPLDKVATAVSTRGMFYDPEAQAERLIFDDWRQPKTFAGVPFQLVDPQQDRLPNVILLYGPQGRTAKMPKSVSLPCNSPAKAIHLLSGVSGWGFPLGEKGSVSLIVRLLYEGGEIEEHALKNGEHFADYIRRVDVPASQFAFDLAGRQVRYLAIQPKRPDRIERIEFVKGPDATAPVIMAVTLESP